MGPLPRGMIDGIRQVLEGRPAVGHYGWVVHTLPYHQPSTRRLPQLPSKYARDGSLVNPWILHLDFCNAFWGPSDAGVDVSLARVRRR